MLKKLLPLLAIFAIGCSSQDIPPAHKGRMFDKTGPLALWSGGVGFTGDILGPGTYVTGVYPEIRMIECAQHTNVHPMKALTKDGVQFTLELNTTYSANCDDNDAIKSIFSKLSPANHLTITSEQLYTTYILPELGESVRSAVSPYIANEINEKREEIFKKINDVFNTSLSAQKPKLVLVSQLNLNNLDFPDAMDKANVERATQAILKDKAIAEREKVNAEIETAKLSVKQAEALAEAEAAKINIVEKALHENPEYYVRDVYWFAADKGGSVMIPTDPKVILNITPKKP